MHALRIQSIALRHFRNIARADLASLPRFVVFSGNNGQGKTSILEAVYLVCTTKSFRTSKLGEIAMHGHGATSVRAQILVGDDLREQSIGMDGAARKVVMQGKRPMSFAKYAVDSPVVVFHPAEMVLSSGPASKRRTLLDRVALFVDPTSMDHARNYVTSSRQRQRTLELKGTRASELDAFEPIMAQHGAALTRARAEAARRLGSELVRSFRRITGEKRDIDARYEPGGFEDAETLREALLGARERDRQRGHAKFGPHRDDLSIKLGGYEARIEASQGEHRAITMALKLAELSCIAEARGVYPVLLLDDVSSELDVSRTALLFEFLRDTPGQILLTTTTPELIDTRGLGPLERRDYHLQSGDVSLGSS